MPAWDDHSPGRVQTGLHPAAHGDAACRQPWSRVGPPWYKPVGVGLEVEVWPVDRAVLPRLGDHRAGGYPLPRDGKWSSMWPYTVIEPSSCWMCGVSASRAVAR